MPSRIPEKFPKDDLTKPPIHFLADWMSVIEACEVGEVGVMFEMDFGLVISDLGSVRCKAAFGDGVEL